MMQAGILLAILVLLAMFVLANVDSVTLFQPANNLWTNENNDSIEFIFRFAADTPTEECTLIINDEESRINSSVQNNTDTTMYSNHSFLNGTYLWAVECGAVQSSVRNCA
jgi:hypothetical protein